MASNTAAVVQYNHESLLPVAAFDVVSCAEAVEAINANSREGVIYLNVFLMIQVCLNCICITVIIIEIQRKITHFFHFAFIHFPYIP